MWQYNNTNELYHFGIKGMKWGVRRYQNEDGTLTPEGKKRYSRDAREKEYNKYDESSGKYYKQSKKNGRTDLEADPNRYVNEDISRTKRVADESANLTRNLKTLNDQGNRYKRNKRLDLSDMSDQELRNKINRELLERQYNDVFNPPTVSKGRQYIGKILETTGTVLAIGSSALGIALAIRDLRGE